MFSMEDLLDLAEQELSEEEFKEFCIDMLKGIRGLPFSPKGKIDRFLKDNK